MDRRQTAGLGILAALIVCAAVFWYWRSLPSPVQVVASGTAHRVTTGSRPGPSASPAAIVVVDVAGWVRRPGVFELHQGDRVIDAIRRAGGAKPGADLTSLNLAALLTDGEQIVVVKPGSGPASGSSAGSSTSAGGSGAGAGGTVVNVNTATLDQLESLPGIGPALGQRIIDYREQHGPFRKVEDLLNVSGIGDQRLADMRSMVTV
jgi:competence protein ComEA